MGLRQKGKKSGDAPWGFQTSERGGYTWSSKCSTWAGLGKKLIGFSGPRDEAGMIKNNYERACSPELNEYQINPVRPTIEAIGYGDAPHHKERAIHKVHPRPFFSGHVIPPRI
eukprot:1160631-Pelagomonas_calceolata.AAC.7